MSTELQLFDEGLGFALDWEGPETNDPDDNGGHTKYGISKAAHPDVDIKNLTLEEASKIYFNEYWQKHFKELNEHIALKLFDLCINPGVTTTIKLFQGVLNNYFKKKLAVDGVLGPNTTSAANSVNQKSLYSAFIYEMSKELESRSNRRKNKKYILGWWNRLYDHPRAKFFP